VSADITQCERSAFRSFGLPDFQAALCVSFSTTPAVCPTKNGQISQGFAGSMLDGWAESSRYFRLYSRAIFRAAIKRTTNHQQTKGTL
jgi:hypothetical protein